MINICSGADGRNSPLICWLCIEEHSCCIGGAVVWGKVHGYSWWPGQIYYRSGIEIIRKNVDISASGTSGPMSSAADSAILQKSVGPSKQGQGQGQSKSPIVLSTPQYLTTAVAASSVYILFFLDGTHYRVAAEEVPNSVVPFLKRVKEVRSGMGKRLSTAYALAVLEIENQRSAKCASMYMSADHLEATGGLGIL